MCLLLCQDLGDKVIEALVDQKPALVTKIQTEAKQTAAGDAEKDSQKGNFAASANQTSASFGTTKANQNG